MAEDTQHDELGELPTRPDRVSTSAAADAVRFMDFDAEVADASGEPVTFRLSGEEFACRNPLPLGSVAVFARRTARIAQTKGVPDDVLALQLAQVEGEALASLLEDEDQDRFERALSRHPDPLIAQKVYRFVITAGTGRPTTPS